MNREESFSLSRREIGFIIAFWALYALLMIVSRVFDSAGTPIPLTPGSLVMPLADALAWATITPVVFWLAARSGADPRPRPVQIAIFLGLGIVIALLLGMMGAELRAFIPRPGWAERYPRPTIWFGFLNGFVLYLGVLAAGLARAYSLRYRARREQASELQTQLAQAHIEALRRQLDPHFLFNTLNAVSSLVERDPRGVRRMIARLSELLRYSLDAEDGPEIPLRKELELLWRYLDIMQVRFQGRLEVQQSVPESVLEVMVPTMVLQPLVENAIKHGVEKQEDGGRIMIEAEAEAGMLVLRVRDNGPYAAAAAVAVNGDYAGGIGVRNTVLRLKQLYGGRQRFSLGPSPEGSGMVAEVRIPLRQSHAQ